jgi:hypothetical protein
MCNRTESAAADNRCGCATRYQRPDNRNTGGCWGPVAGGSDAVRNQTQLFETEQQLFINPQPKQIRPTNPCNSKAIFLLTLYRALTYVPTERR